MDKQFLFKITARLDDGKRRTSQRLFTGKPEEARAAAKKLHNTLQQEGCTEVRVEIWQIIATEYKGAIRR